MYGEHRDAWRRTVDAGRGGYETSQKDCPRRAGTTDPEPLEYRDSVGSEAAHGPAQHSLLVPVAADARRGGPPSPSGGHGGHHHQDATRRRRRGRTRTRSTLHRARCRGQADPPADAPRPDRHQGHSPSPPRPCGGRARPTEAVGSGYGRVAAFRASMDGSEWPRLTLDARLARDADPVWGRGAGVLIGLIL